MRDPAIQILGKCVKPLCCMLLVLFSPMSHAIYSAQIVIDNERVESGDASRGEDSDRAYYAVDVSARLAPQSSTDTHPDRVGLIPFELFRFLFLPTWNESALAPGSSATAPYMTVDDPLGLAANDYEALGGGLGVGLSPATKGSSESAARSFGVGTAIFGHAVDGSTTTRVNLDYGTTARLFTLRLRIEDINQPPQVEFPGIINGDSVLTRADNSQRLALDRENPVEHMSADFLVRPNPLEFLLPRAQFATDTVVVTEGGVAEVTVDLSMNPLSDTEVFFDIVGISDGFSAGGDLDVAASNFTSATETNDQGMIITTNSVVVVRGEVTTTIEIQIQNDMLNEGDESFYVQFDPETSPVAAPTRTRVTIAASDPIAVSLARMTGDAGGAEGTSAAFVVTLSGGDATAGTTIAWDVTTSTDRSPPASTSDFEAVTGEVRIAAGDTVGTIYVPIADDDAAEIAEYYTLTLRQPTGGGSGRITLSNPAVTAQIPANDPQELTFDAANSSLSVDEGDAAARFAIDFGDSDARVPTTLTFRYRLSGSAQGGSDYVYPRGYDGDSDSGTFAIAITTNTVTVSLSINDDDLDEDEETIVLEVLEAVMGAGAVTLASNLRSTATISDNDKLSLAVAASPMTITEDPVSTATIAVSLLNAGAPSMRTLSSDVRVAYTLMGSATGSGTDYEDPDGYNPTASSGVVVLSAGSTSAEVLLATASDDDSEGDETIDFRLTEVVTGGTLAELRAADTTRVTVTINDDDVDRNFYISSNVAPVAEGAMISYMVGYDGMDLSGANTVTVRWVVEFAAGMRAASAADLMATTGDLMFTASHAAGMEQAITLSALADNLNEGDETFTVRIIEDTDLTSGVYSTGSTVMTTITDDPNDALQISIARSDTGDLVEGGSVAERTAEFAVSVANAVATAPLTIPLTAGGSVSMGDYTPVPAMIVIPPSTSRMTISVAAVDDDLNEGAETLRVELGAVQGALGDFSVTMSSATAVIAANDPITVSLERLANDAGGAEGTTAAFVVALAGGRATTETLIGWDVLFGEGVDQAVAADIVTATRSGEVRLAADDTTGTIGVAIFDDDTLELAESYTVRLRTLMGGGAGEITSSTFMATAEIPLSDVQELVFDVDEMDLPTTVVEDGDEEAKFELVVGDRTIRVPTTITLHYRLSGTAEGGTDYEYPEGYDIDNSSGTFAVAISTYTGTVSLEIINDEFNEDAETIVLEIREVGLGADLVNLPPNLSRTVTIEDDDKLSLTVAASHAATVEDSEEEVTFMVSLLNAGRPLMRPLTQEVRVAYNLGGVAMGGGTDYTDPTGYNAGASSGVVALSVGSTSAEVSITVVDDMDMENITETIRFELREVVLGEALAELRAPGTTFVEVLLIDDESQVRSFYISTSAESVAEGDAIMYTIGYVGEQVMTTPASARWVVEGAGARPAEDADFEEVAGIVTFTSAGSMTEQMFPLQTAADTLNEGDEEFTVRIESLDFYSRVSATAASVMTTLTDDPDDAMEISIVRIDTGDLLETGDVTDATARFEVRTGNATPTAPLTVSFTIDGDVTPDDYEVAAPRVRIPAYSPAAQFGVQAADDNINEGAETLRVILDTVVGARGTATISATMSSASVVIAENDEITVSVRRLGTSEDTGGAEGTTAVFVVVLSGGDATTDTMVDWYISSLSEEQGSASTNDFVVTSGTLSLPLGVETARINVPIFDDEDLEAAESYTLALRNLTGGGEGPIVLAAPAQDQIPPSDRIPLSVAVQEPSSGRVTEADEGTVSFWVTYGDGMAPPSEEVTVRYRLQGTAEGEVDYDYPADYDAVSGTVTIGTGTTRANVSLTVNDDEMDEADETIVIRLDEVVAGDAVAEVPPNTVATVTIEDDDKLTLSLSAASPALESGGTVEFTVSLLNIDVPPTRARTSEVRVAYTLSSQDATGGGVDYTEPTGYSMSSGVVVLGAGDNRQDVLITVQEDLISEPDETITLVLTRIIAGGELAEFGPTTAVDLVITDNDPLQAQIQIIGDASTTEADTTLVFEVALTPDTISHERDVIVSYTIGGDNIDGRDYTDVGGGSVTIGTNDSTAHIMVTLIDDDTFESDEMLTVTLQSATGANVEFPDAMRSASITIRNNDAETMGVMVSAGVYLQGAYLGNGSMRTDRLILSLPRQQPYGVSPWNYPATTTVPFVDAEFNLSGVTSTIVDWVLVELRTSAAGEGARMAALSRATTGARAAGLLLSDGRIVGINEEAAMASEALLLDGVRFEAELPEGEDVYVLIDHRNHVPIISAQPVTSTDCDVDYCVDFRAQQSYVDCGQLRHSDGSYGMYAGDVNRDSSVSLGDRAFILIVNGSEGFQTRTLPGGTNYISDGDLDFVQGVTLGDRAVILENNGQGSPVCSPVR